MVYIASIAAVDEEFKPVYLHARAKGKEVNIRAGIVGSSIFFQHGTLNGRWFGFMVGMGIQGPSQTRLFSVFAAERGSGDEEEVREFIESARQHEISIAMEDAGIAQTINFRVRCLTKSDATLAKFFCKGCGSFHGLTP